ncbi:5841_t:CDS:2 [Ambispora gerdemannii]|uniref:5841_t:CDS:1 n=1 Tax=Ambispora gerdemannii TaxID=144530 RepID=A0A9N9AIA3_9GLOM|nr:5841_t:CDS:2 [Ambispora gerdemannii]
MAKVSLYTLLLLLVCLLVIVRATPIEEIEDVSDTTIDVTETQESATKESFTVEIDRTDDLVNEDVQLGITSVTIIEAKIISVDNATDDVSEELEDSFDLGLVTVEVSSSAESFPTDDPSVSLRRVTISTRIVEVDGVDVVQTDAVEKILEVKVLNVLDDDSEDLEFVPISSNNIDMPLSTVHGGDSPHSPCSLSSFAGRVRHWWRCSSRFTRVIIASIFLTSVFGLVFIALPTAAHSLILAARRRRGIYQQVAVHEEEELTKSEQVIYIADEEKRALMDQDIKH